MAAFAMVHWLVSALLVVFAALAVCATCVILENAARAAWRALVAARTRRRQPQHDARPNLDDAAVTTADGESGVEVHPATSTAAPRPERASSITDECFLCCDSSRADGGALVRGVCRRKGATMHIGCQKRMVDAARVQGGSDALRCGVCRSPFSNVEYRPGRPQLTATGCLWVFVMVGSIGVVVCAIAILEPRGHRACSDCNESLGWLDYVLACLQGVEQASLRTEHSWLRLFGLFYFIFGVGTFSSALVWFAAFVSGVLERTRVMVDLHHGGAGPCLQPPYLSIYTVTVWDPATQPRNERRSGTELQSSLAPAAPLAGGAAEPASLGQLTPTTADDEA